MATEYLTPENDAQWLEWRKSDITSTESSALFGLSPYTTPFELFYRKRDGIADPLDDNERMQAGRHIEPAIASLVAERFGVIVTPMKIYARDPADRMGSSFDYQVGANHHAKNSQMHDLWFHSGPGILECKNVDSLAFKQKWQDDETPAHIEIQLQHQLELTGYAWGVIAALVGGNDLRIYARTRDERVGRGIRQAIRNFWQSVRDNNPPPPQFPGDAAAVIAMHQFSDASVLDARDNQSLNALLAEYDALGTGIMANESAREVIKAQVLQQVGDAGTVLHPGGKLVLTQTADSPEKQVTQDMVGTMIGARSGYRMFRNYPAKTKES